jgi:hypothetical protein
VLGTSVLVIVAEGARVAAEAVTLAAQAEVGIVFFGHLSEK